MQEHYENTIVASERKRAEERIAFLHERAKPMGFDAMNEHDMKVTLRRQQAEQEAEKNRALRIKELRQTQERLSGANGLPHASVIAAAGASAGASAP